MNSIFKEIKVAAMHSNIELLTIRMYSQANNFLWSFEIVLYRRFAKINLDNGKTIELIIWVQLFNIWLKKITASWTTFLKAVLRRMKDAIRL